MNIQDKKTALYRVNVTYCREMGLYRVSFLKGRKRMITQRNLRGVCHRGENENGWADGYFYTSHTSTVEAMVGRWIRLNSMQMHILSLHRVYKKGGK